MKLLQVANVGQLGVRTGESPLHMPDGSVALAQNVYPKVDRNQPGLATRPGFPAHTPVAGGGALLAAAPFNFASSVTSAAVLELFAGLDSADAWRSTLTGTSLAMRAGLARPQAKTLLGTLADILLCNPAACWHDGALYYADNGYTQYPNVGHQPPTVRRYDGKVDAVAVVVSQAAIISGAVNAYFITSLASINGNLLVGVADSAYPTASPRGRVLVWDGETLTQVCNYLGTTAATVQDYGVPMAVCAYQGNVYAGTQRWTNDGRILVGSAASSLSTAWKLDATWTSEYVTGLVEYDGDLYATTWSAGAVAPHVYRLDRLTGVWAASFTGTSGSTSVLSVLGVYDGDLYVGEFINATGACRVLAWDGATWTASLTLNAIRNYGRWGMGAVYANKLWAVVTLKNGAGSTGLLLSFDGATWTEVEEGQTTRGFLVAQGADNG